MKITDFSAIKLVYPFVYERTSYDQRVAQTSAAKWSTHPLWEAVDISNHEFLPHVERYLDYENSEAFYAWQLSKAALNSWRGVGAKDTIWTTKLRNSTVQVHLVDISLSLFRTGVGFFVMTIRLDTDDPDRWLDLLHFSRFTNQRGIELKMEIDVSRDEGSPCYWPYESSLQSEVRSDPTLKRLINGLLETMRVSDDGHEKRWHSDVYVGNQLLHFATLFIDGCDPLDQPSMLYRIRRCFYSDQHIIPSKEDLSLQRDDVAHYADKHYWQFGLDGGSFVGFDSPGGFFRDVLPQHLHSQYFTIFLLALHQRFALMTISREIAEIWEHTPSKSLNQLQRELDPVRFDIMAFTAKHHFGQVMQLTHHHHYYKSWMRVFEIDDLYREVSGESREIHEYVIASRSKRIEQVISIIGMGSVLLALWTGLRASFPNIGFWPNLITSLCFLTTGFVMGMLLFRIRRFIKF